MAYLNTFSNLHWSCKDFNNMNEHSYKYNSEINKSFLPHPCCGMWFHHSNATSITPH